MSKTYTVEFSKELVRKMSRIQKKNKQMFDAIVKKIREIKKNPAHYKQLRYGMKNYRRAHIMKSFVLIFRIDREHNKVIFEDFDHHDKIYKK